MIGKLISHYKILEKLGEGGMGEVYKAEDTKLKRQVALKFLPLQMTADPEAKERFEREAQAAAALNHPNIITVYEIGEHEGQVFIAMEYLEGRTLKDLISIGARRAVPLPITDVIDIATQIAEGLAAAHAKGIVHRDIKPQNILVDKNSRVKILDFGLAKLKGVSLLTKESSTLGTVHYMSPEQALGKDVDQRSDIWSLGVVMYETLTGQAPFKGTYDQAVIYSILNEEPEPLTGGRPDAPAELQAIVGKCLEKEIDVRYQHADDLSADLKRAKRDTKPVAPPGKLAMSRAPRKKSRPLMAVAASSLVIAALATAAYFLFKPKAKHAEVARPAGRHSLAVVYFENGSGDKSLDKWRSQLAELLITDLSQSRYIDVVSGDQIFGILKKLNLLDAAKYSNEDLRQVAELGGSDYLLHGSYITAGKNLLINVALQEARSGKIVSAQRLEARGEEEIFGKVDEITRRIKLDCDFTPQQLASDPDTELAAITTRSPQAYEYFNQGETQKWLANQRQCIKLMEKAVAIDPDFAMAWRTMATAYGNLYYFAEERKYLKKAMDLGGRVSERERLLIAGQYYKLAEKSYPQAIAFYEKVLGLYPEDSIAALHLGNLYRDLELWDKAEPLYRINLLKPDQDRSHYSSMNLADMYGKMGEYQKALQVLTYQQSRFPNHPYISWGLADSNLSLGRYEAAMDIVDKALAISREDPSNTWEKGDIFFCRGDLARAEAWFRKILDFPEASSQSLGLICISALAQARGRYDEAKSFHAKLLSLYAPLHQAEWERMSLETLAYLDYQLGNWAEAQKMLDRILADAKEQDDWKWLRTIYYDKGVVYAGAGMLPAAQEMAIRLQACIDQGMNKKLRRMHDHLQGMIALQKGDAPGAVRLIQQAIALLPGGMNGTYRDTLGDACLKAGKLQEARQAYEAVTLSPTGRMNAEYGRCLLMLGKTCEKLGETEKAIRNFTQFRELYEGCDSRFRPLVAEAEQAITRLRGGTRR